ncbi:aminotransferase class V-fold PLP-dependent enzyme [Acinetobacter puyangensis]|uniref:aminotransferase class V-fold PLP-dependent enzyme n=1 Tax=Acinetobacter puyangensis TaxID=1096779 RepID=UPI003A4D6208
MHQQIYLDYAATTPVDPLVTEKMVQCLNFEGNFGNPASRSHDYGIKAGQAVEQARAQVAALIHADPREIIWTSGATESNNLALKGIAQYYADQGKHIITSQIEHKAILDTCHELEQQGFEITYLQPEAKTGLITPEMVAQALRPETLLVSLMMVNNEIGTRTDIATIGELVKANHSFFHVDAAQAAGKFEIDLQKFKVDLMSFSGHKIYGPKGIGALYVRRHPAVQLKAQMHGGGHEQGMRSGTLATHQIVGMGMAFALAQPKLHAEQQRLGQLKQKLLQGLQDYADVQVNGALASSVANYLNISFKGKNAMAVMNTIKSVAAVSSGSACNSHQSAPSHVLSAMQIPLELSENAIRFSFGAYTSEQDIDRLLAAIAETKSLKKFDFFSA